MWACTLLTAVLLSSTPRAQGEDADEQAPADVQVVVVPVTGEIGVRTLYMVQDSLRRASSGVRKVVLEIDTPGGLIDAMRDIETMLSNFKESGVQTVAYVRRSAWSAGAYIALACHEIYMAPGSSIGAITPVVVGPGGAAQIPEDDVRKKQISVLRADIRALVERREVVPPGLATAAEAMVDPGMRVFEVTYEEDGVQQTAILDEEELRTLEDRGIEVVQRTGFVTAPLTLTAEEAERLGFSSGTIGSLRELVEEEFLLPWESVEMREETWSEGAVAWLDTIKPLLFVFGFMLLVLELKTPGLALPGVLGVLLLGLAMFGSYLVGLAEWTEILLFFAGIALVAVEIFVMPGTLVFGLAGLVCLVSGLILSQQSFFIPANAAQQDILLQNLTQMLLLTALVIGCAILLWRLTPHIPVFNRILQAPPERPSTGASTQFASASAVDTAGADLVGTVGEAVTDLRPVGSMEANGERYDVLAEGTFVSRGTRVRIVSMQGNQLFVEPVDEAERGEINIGWLILMLVLGVCFAIAEIFFPSAGVLAVLSAVGFVASIFLAYTQHSLVMGHVFLVTAAILAPTAIYWALRIFPSTPMGKRFLQTGPDREYVARAAEEPNIDRFLHQTGEALSSLRPAGSARIAGERVDVITRGEMLDKGVAVRVIQVEGNRVVVAELDTVTD